MPVSKDEFRAALSRFASGVTVVTTKTEANQPSGLTVSSFASLSLEPPLVLVCIDKRAAIHELLIEGRYFAVNVLEEAQELISRRFAARDTDRFSGTGYVEGVTGVPVLSDVLAAIECRIVHTYAGGDHTIVVGEVERTLVNDGKPLTYFRGGYTELA